MTSIDVCIPTFNSGNVLEGTLDRLKCAEDYCSIKISTLRVTDNKSTDSTTNILEEVTDEYGWGLDLEKTESSLPEARQSLISRVKSDWFLFLDDDVRLSEDYFELMFSCMAEGIGAIQGRKKSKQQTSSNDQRLINDVPTKPTEWVRKRSFRGGTHATLIRKEACEDIKFPCDLVVWEDEYLRRHIESSGYLWIFNHQALFSHANQERHPPSWTEGYLQAKYNLRPFWHVCLNLPYAILTGKSPIGYMLMIVGYVCAWLKNLVN